MSMRTAEYAHVYCTKCKKIVTVGITTTAESWEEADELSIVKCEECGNVVLEFNFVK